MRILIVLAILGGCSYKREVIRLPSSESEENSSKIEKKEKVLIIEFKQIPASVEIKIVKGLVPGSKIELFDNYPSDYFRRLYRLSFKADPSNEKEYGEKLKSIKFLKRIEQVHFIEDLSIQIDNNIKPLTNDLFFNYLWGLKNSGQKVFKDLDDIHMETLESKPGADIGWEKIKDKLPELMKNEVVVAVIDSGVDVEHPDLKENIFKNQIECSTNSSIPFKPKEDKDENGYIGDCAGWNFTSGDTSGDNRPTDDLGHGTHVAGIISAISNNKIGITGISNKIKMLPIKVLKKESGRSSSQNGSISDRVAKGVLYALKRGAKVINLSLGWPIILDTNYLRETFKTALDNNVTIVAASGNNNNNAPIFPCAYENVICVSSIGVDGKISGFSNFGGHVDLLAPGDNILSTFPTIKEPEIFFAKGYEIKNGTSQASPFVAASAAVIKSVFPGISEDELKARLFLTSRPISSSETDDEKYSSQGLIHLESALEVSEQSLTIPILKDLNSIAMDPGTLSFTIPLKIKNFWKKSNKRKIFITSLSENFEIENGKFEFENLTPDEIQIIPIKGIVKNLDEDHNFIFQVEIQDGIKSNLYKENIKIVSNIGNRLTKFPLLGLKDKDLVKDGEFFFPKFKTVSDPLFLSRNPLYYTWETEEGGISITLFKKDKDFIGPIKNTLKIPGAKNIISLLLLDANYDGKLDFFVGSIATEGDLQLIKYSFFDGEGLPLFGQYSHWIFKPESVILDLNRIHFLHFVPYEINPLGKVAIPVQLNEGTIPEIDQNPDPFVKKDPRKMSHIFYFEPKIENEKVILKSRIIDNFRFLKSMRKRLNLAFNDSIFLLSSIPQNKFDLEKGNSRFLISAGKNYFTKNYIIKLRKDFDVDFQPLDTNELHFEGSNFFPITNLGEDHFILRDGLSIIGVYNQFTMRATGIEKEKMTFTTIYNQSRKTDSLVAAMSSYRKGNKTYTFFQTKGYLKTLIQELGREDIVLSRPIIRFSFIPGELFTETFYPIVRGSWPALYIDTTQISGNDVYILTLDKNNKLISPIKYNLRVPPNCKSLNPVPQEGNFSFTLICQTSKDEKSWSLQFLEIK